jgi:hypothetical protein
MHFIRRYQHPARLKIPIAHMPPPLVAGYFDRKAIRRRIEIRDAPSGHHAHHT